jgi:hypothetical protein
MESQATLLYQEFPRSFRASLHKLLIKDPESPFRDGPDDSYFGRGFAIALSEYTAPITNVSLPQLLNGIQLKGLHREVFVRLCVRYMTQLCPTLLQEDSDQDLELHSDEE